MKNKILFLLLMITTALSWSLEAEGQTTNYVLNKYDEIKLSIGETSSVYELSGPGLKLTFEAYKNARTAINQLYVHTSIDNKTWKEKVYTIGAGDLNYNSYKEFSFDIDNNVRYIKFNNVGSYSRYVRNVKVTRATTLSASSSSLAFGNVKYGDSSNQTINVTYNNTYSDAVISATCNNSAFSVNLGDTNMRETGSKEITVTYNPTTLGTHEGTVTLTMGTKGKNNNVTATFDVSGTCNIDYTYSATANTSNAEFGTAQVNVGNQTKTNGVTATVNETSTTSPSTKDAVFTATPSDGYSFVGWYYDAGYTNRVSTSAEYRVTLTASTDIVSPSSTLYAKFEVDKTAAQQTIDDFEAVYESKTDDPQAATDLASAKTALANAVTKEEVSASTASLKQFDTVTFDEEKDNNIEKDGALSTDGLASSQNGLSIVYSSSDESVIKVLNGELQAIGVGSAVITATSSGNGYYRAKDTRSFTVYTVGKGTATITINAPASLTIDDEVTDVFTLSNETVTPTVSFSKDGILEYVDGTLRAIGAGTVTMYVRQSETADWNPAQADKEITVVKHTNAVTWAEDKTTSMVALSTLDLSDYATSVAGNITFTSSNTEIIEVVGQELRAHKAGSAVITATAAETEKYDEASNVLEFTVTKASATIRWEQVLPALNDRVQSGVELTAVVVDAAGTIIEGAVVQYVSNNTDVVTVNGSILTPRSGGSTTVKATYAGNDVYAAAADVSKPVSVDSYNVTTTWINDWSSAPAAGAQFYLYNTTNSKFLQEGHGENQASSFVDAENASLWKYTDEPKIVSVNNSANYIANKTNEASTDGTGNASNYVFNYNNGAFQLQSSAQIFGTQHYDVCNRDGNFSGYHNGNHFEWYLISEAQYEYRMTDVPEAIEYLYGEGEYSKYLRVVGTTRDNLVAATKLNSNFNAARTTIAAAMQAFDDYVAELEKLDAFVEVIAENTPDVDTAQGDYDDAVQALTTADGSETIKAVYGQYIKKFVTLSATYPTSIPKASDGKIVGIAKSNEETVAVEISYSSNDSSVFTVDADGTIHPQTEGTATITLTTATANGYYAAMPFTTASIEVTDRLTLSNATVASYTPGEYGTVVIERTLKEGYNSIAIPFDVALSALNADWAAQLSIVAYNTNDGYSLYFQKFTEGTLNANEPYIIHVTAQTENPQFSNVTVEAAVETTKQATGGVNADGHSYADWAMHSNYTPAFDMVGKYGVVNVDGVLKIGGSGATLSAFGAYITGLAAAGGSNQKVATRFVDDDELAGIIEQIEAGAFEDTTIIYDLSGRVCRERLSKGRTSNAANGVKIEVSTNGKSRKVLR